ncbi:MAG: cob(I)yrinic acid a,c-diamide adenosyltransferase [Clostridiales bacterium]
MEHKLQQGLIEVYTGNGKGKSTASFGLAIRAAGQGLKIRIIQFMKTINNYGENIALDRFPEINVSAFGRDCLLRKGQISEEDKTLAGEALAESFLAMGEDYDLLILDEINNALFFELIELKDVLRPEELIEKADLVTEMKEIKHPYSKNIAARRGIEF